MWNANKVAIILLLIGLSVLVGIHYYMSDTDPVLARKIVAVGTCFLLFTTATGTWLSVRRELKKMQ